MKSLRYITTIFVATSFIDSQAQTEQMVADTVTTDTAAVVLPWPQNVQTRLDSLMLDPLLESTQIKSPVKTLSLTVPIYRSEVFNL